MHTLIPQPAAARALPIGRSGRLLGFGLRPRALILLALGFLLAIPAFWHPRLIVLVFAWDALVLAAALLERSRLPHPGQLTVTRSFLDAPQLGVPTRLQITLTSNHPRAVRVRVVDDLHPALTALPLTADLELFPRDPSTHTLTFHPAQRGEFRLGPMYLHLRSRLGLVERWAAAHPTATLRVYPAHEHSRGSFSLFLQRARQIELQRRKLRLRDQGREFDSLRDYQPGDEIRAISWPATARRGKVVTRQFTAERSQEVWILLDAGRLSRTAFELRRDPLRLPGETESERASAFRLPVTQLDQAATAAVMLAQVTAQSGDRFALLTYGREVRQVLPPGSGPAHLRLLLDLLSATRHEAAEADPFAAVARLKLLQSRRSLIIWITELADAAGTPEMVTAAAELARRHLVVLVLLHHPELEALAAHRPAGTDAMFHAAAATEMLTRRRATLAELERRGVLLVEATAAELGVHTVSKYLEVKARGLL